MAVPVHEGLFETDPAALLGARCNACGEHHFPRLGQCPYCGDEHVEPVRLSDHGTLWGWTAVTTAPPGFRGAVPFGFGVVELPERLRVITRLAYPVDAYRFGQPLQLCIVALHHEDEEPVLTWEFGP